MQKSPHGVILYTRISANIEAHLKAIFILLEAINRLSVCLYFAAFYDKIETIVEVIFFSCQSSKITSQCVSILPQNVTK
jgi:hypothetical protein